MLEFVHVELLLIRIGKCRQGGIKYTINFLAHLGQAYGSIGDLVRSRGSFWEQVDL